MKKKPAKQLCYRGMAAMSLRELPGIFENDVFLNQLHRDCRELDRQLARHDRRVNLARVYGVAPYNQGFHPEEELKP